MLMDSIYKKPSEMPDYVETKITLQRHFIGPFCINNKILYLSPLKMFKVLTGDF